MRPKQTISLRTSDKVSIDDIARLAHGLGAIDLALGCADQDIDPCLRDAGIEAMRGGFDQYEDTRGIEPLREAIADKIWRQRRIKINPECEITVTSGATEALMASLSCVARAGDEVIIFEPGYEQYMPMIRLLGAKLRTIRLSEPGWEIKERELEAAFGNRTAAFILNTPHNPTGKVCTIQELQRIADYCERFGVICIADEVYEHFVFDDAHHVSISELEGMIERTVVISTMSKTYSAPGWRIGFAVAPKSISSAILERHELFSGGAPSPLQAAATIAFRMQDSFYGRLRAGYQRRRDYLSQSLSSLGFHHSIPKGGFYIFASVPGVGEICSQEFTVRLMKEAGVASVPGSCFYSDPSHGRSLARFCFAKSATTLEAASLAISRWVKRGTFDTTLVKEVHGN